MPGIPQLTVQVIGDLHQFLLPRSCAGCGARATWWCQACHAHVSGTGSVVTEADSGLQVAYAALYDGPARRLVLDYKDRGVTALARPLGGLLAAAVAAHPARRGPMALVPVPCARRSSRRRGGDVLLAVVRLAAQMLGIPVQRRLLWNRQPRAQKALPAAERAANVRGAIGVRAAGKAMRSRGCRVLVVDDVMTTGSTVAECTRALRAAGAQVAGAAVVACAPRDP